MLYLCRRGQVSSAETKLPGRDSLVEQGRLAALQHSSTWGYSITRLQSHNATCWLLIMLEMEKRLHILTPVCCPNNILRRLHPAYLVGKVVAVHFVAVGLTSWTLDLDAMALQDGCFFKNTEPIIEHQTTETTTTATCGQAAAQSQSERGYTSDSIPTFHA